MMKKNNFGNFKVYINSKQSQVSNLIRKIDSESANYQMQDFHIRIDESQISSQAFSSQYFICVENSLSISYDKHTKVVQSIDNEDLISISSNQEEKTYALQQKQAASQIISKIERKIRKKQKKQRKSLLQHQLNSQKNFQHINSDQLVMNRKNPLFAKNGNNTNCISELTATTSIKPIKRIPRKSYQAQISYKVPATISFPILSHKESVVNFGRNFMLQELMCQKQKQTKLLTNIIRAIYINKSDAMQLLTIWQHKLQQLTPKLFDSYEQYQKTFKEMHQCEVLFRLCERIRQIQHRMQRSEGQMQGQRGIKIKVLSQHCRADSFYQLKVVVLEDNEDNVDSSDYKCGSNKKLKLQDIISKFRLGLISSDQHLESYNVVGYLQGIKKQGKSELFTLISPRGYVQLPTIVDLYHIDKFTTQIRDHDAITNLKYSELLKYILNPQIIQKRKDIHDKSPHKSNQLINLFPEIEKKFNYSQFQSIKQISEDDIGIFLLQGPPGTGKTSTLLGLLSCELSKLKYFNNISSLNLKILVCTPSNAAADHITQRIIHQGLISANGEQIMPNILRIGIVESVGIQSVCLFEITNKFSDLQKRRAQISKRQVHEMIQKLRKQIQQLQKLEHDVENRYARQYKKDQISLYHKYLDKKSDCQAIQIKDIQSWVERGFINQSSIIVTTLTSSYSQKILNSNVNFSCLIVDEAAQATEPNLLIPLQLGIKKITLIGDPQQLPPTITNRNLLKKRYNRSLFQRFLENNIDPHFLNIQYRMNPLIRQFPGMKFYNSRLRDCEDIDVQTAINRSFYLKTRQATFISCVNSQQRRVNKSYCNDIQANIIIELVARIIQVQLSIGVITPYQGQSEMIRRGLRFKISQIVNNYQLRQSLLQKVTISTVDSYQGQERDVIIFSTVRSNIQCNLGFTNDCHRINVGLTRAKKALITVGNQQTLVSSKIWKQYIQWIKQRGTFLTCNTMLQPITRIVDGVVENNQRNIHNNGRIFMIHEAEGDY